MLLFHTDNLPHYGLDRIFALAKKSGFDGIEIGVSHNLDSQNAAYIQELEKRHQINVHAFSITPKHEESVIQAFHHTAREFNKITLNLPVPKTLNHKYKKWFTEIAPKLAKKYHLTFCKKNVPTETVMGFLPGRSGNSLQELKASGGVCLDLTALAISNEEIMKSIDILSSNLRHVYLSNVYRDQSYYNLQKGVLPIESFLSKLARMGYRGDFSLYVKEKYLHAESEEKIIQSLIETRAFFDKYFTAEKVSV